MSRTGYVSHVSLIESKNQITHAKPIHGGENAVYAPQDSTEPCKTY